MTTITLDLEDSIKVHMRRVYGEIRYSLGSWGSREEPPEAPGIEEGALFYEDGSPVDLEAVMEDEDQLIALENQVWALLQTEGSEDGFDDLQEARQPLQEADHCRCTDHQPIDSVYDPEGTCRVTCQGCGRIRFSFSSGQA